eukprot:GILI01006608.1.p1 GENE.GILI01006608.1~~GILI01006608.1.p1  ORF type:complete len:713 (-),score=107.59 GILI01006608.1:72-2048(-)
MVFSLKSGGDKAANPGLDRSSSVAPGSPIQTTRDERSMNKSSYMSPSTANKSILGSGSLSARNKGDDNDAAEPHENFSSKSLALLSSGSAVDLRLAKGARAPTPPPASTATPQPPQSILKGASYQRTTTTANNNSSASASSPKQGDRSPQPPPQKFLRYQQLVEQINESILYRNRFELFDAAHKSALRNDVGGGVGASGRGGPILTTTGGADYVRDNKKSAMAANTANKQNPLGSNISNDLWGAGPTGSGSDLNMMGLMPTSKKNTNAGGLGQQQQLARLTHSSVASHDIHTRQASVTYLRNLQSVAERYLVVKSIFFGVSLTEHGPKTTISTMNASNQTSSDKKVSTSRQVKNAVAAVAQTWKSIFSGRLDYDNQHLGDRSNYHRADGMSPDHSVRGDRSYNDNNSRAGKSVNDGSRDDSTGSGTAKAGVPPLADIVQTVKPSPAPLLSVHEFLTSIGRSDLEGKLVSSDGNGGGTDDAASNETTPTSSRKHKKGHKANGNTLRITEGQQDIQFGNSMSIPERSLRYGLSLTFDADPPEKWGGDDIDPTEAESETTESESEDSGSESSSGERKKRRKPEVKSRYMNGVLLNTKKEHGLESNQVDKNVDTTLVTELQNERLIRAHVGSSFLSANTLNLEQLKSGMVKRPPPTDKKGNR